MTIIKETETESRSTIFEKLLSKMNSAWGMIATIVAIFSTGYGFGSFISNLSNKYDMLVMENEYREKIQDLKMEVSKKETELQIKNSSKNE